jgi:hypothetical protein
MLSIIKRYLVYLPPLVIAIIVFPIALYTFFQAACCGLSPYWYIGLISIFGLAWGWIGAVRYLRKYGYRPGNRL